MGIQAELPSPPRGLSPVTAQAIDAGSKEAWRYLLYLPERYFEKTQEPLPVLLYLHGSSGRGRDLEMLKRYGPPSRLKNQADFAMAMIAPQLPEGGWHAPSLLALLDEVLAAYRFDPDRVYLTGVSLGGQGSWALAAAAPGRFAAFAPVCGYGSQSDATRLTKLPIWAFHGAQDDVVPIGPHQALIDAVNAAKGEAKLTIFENGDHGNIIVPIYAREGQGRLYDWFLRHRRGQSSPVLSAEERLERLPGPGSKASPSRQSSTPPPVAEGAPVPPVAEGVPVPPAAEGAPVPPAAEGALPRPGEFWDLLFRALEGESPKPQLNEDLRKASDPTLGSRIGD